MYHVMNFPFSIIVLNHFEFLMNVHQQIHHNQHHCRLRTSAIGRNSCPMDYIFPQKVPAWWNFSWLVANLISDVLVSESWTFMNPCVV